MPDTTPHLGLPLIAAAQAQKHVTHNEALDLLDALVQLACLDKDLAAPPPSPGEGDRYLVTAADPGGAWAGLSGQVARFSDGVWTGSVPSPGWFAYVVDEADLYVFDGVRWTSFRRSVAAIQQASRLGINTAPDAVNRLAVKSDAALLSWDDATPGSGDMRVAINKQAAVRDAALAFQTSFSARALIGTLGGDDFSLKVSPDGAAFATALTASAANGGIDFASAETPVASAAAIDLGAAGTRRILVTGAAAVASFGTAANRERFLRFAGAATLVHDATRLVLPTRANIVAGPDDTCIATSDAAGNWRVRHYQRADGMALANGVVSVAGRSGAVSLTSADLADATAPGRAVIAAASAAAGRSALSAAASGANGDITALSGLTTALTVGQGGTGAGTAAAALANLGGAPLASAALTGTPTAPTATPGTATAQVATTGFVAASFVTYAYAGATYAPLANATLTGTPTAPTQAAGDASTRIATTAYTDRAASAALARTQVSDANYAALPADRLVAFIALTAARTVTLPAASAFPQGARLLVVDESGACSGANAITLARNGTSDAVNGAASATIAAAYGYLALESNGANKWTVVDAPAPVTTVAGRTGAVSLTSADLTDATAVGKALVTAASAAGALFGLGGAPLASPALTGTPTAPTAAAGTSTAQVATTGFVSASFVTYAYAASTYATLASPTLTGTPTAPTPSGGDNSTKLATTAFVAAGFAPLASPALTGTPTAPTAAAGTNSGQVATTSFVAAGFITYSYASATYATLASPTLTGTPTAPTPAARDNSTKLATTAYADRGVAALTARAQVSDAAYAILSTDRTVAVIALTAARTLTLPAAGAFPQGATLTVMDESGACTPAAAITLAVATPGSGQSADTINGAGTAAITAAYGYLALQSNGANKWTVIDQAPGMVPAMTVALGAAGSNVQFGILEQFVSLSGSSTASSIQIPNRAIVFAVSSRVVTAVTGAPSFGVGVSGNASQFGGSLGTAAGSTNSGVIGPTAFYAPTALLLTATSGSFTGGAVRLAIHYAVFGPPTV